MKESQAPDGAILCQCPIQRHDGTGDTGEMEYGVAKNDRRTKVLTKTNKQTNKPTSSTVRP